MSSRTKPPFRADHVGSFLRPPELLAARERFQNGEISKAGLRAVEDRAIAEIVRMQEGVGLQGVTDGEFRRTYFHIDFLEQLEGVETRGGLTAHFHGKKGDVDFAPPVLRVTKKVRHLRPIQVADFNFLKSATKRTPKVSIPSPTMLHFRGGREAISREAYPDLDEFFADVAAAYGAELKALGAAGCTYVQLDDTNLAYLCDPKMREGARARGDDPDELPRRYARLINAAIAGRPPASTIKLQGILWSQTPVAIINGRSFGLNDTGKIKLGGSLVTIRCLTITPDFVRIQRSDSDKPDKQIQLGLPAN